jgi:uncharacterized membrane-anchored protein YhcB (DUF1043 family)
MIWIVGALCFLGGAAVGILLFKQLASDEVRVKELEEQLQALSREHELYKTGVHDHFKDSAQLLGKLTDSYREVYLHMADGARSLCPDYISSQLDLDREGSTFPGNDKARARDSSLHTPMPPLDYAPKTSKNSKGLLSEDYELGLGKDDIKP